MICPSCGHENRSQARFCARCGTPLPAEPAEPAAPPEPAQERELEATEPALPPAARPEAPAAPQAPAAQRATAARRATAAQRAARKERSGLLGIGSSGLVTLGALIVLFAFMLPWASCGSVKLSGLDMVTQSQQLSDYGGNRSAVVLLLVPLGALGLLILGGAGLISALTEGTLPAGLSKVGRLLPLVAVLPGLCSCCPSLGFLVQMQSARSNPDTFGLGMLIQIESGFWLTLVGLGISFIGVAAAVLNALTSRGGAPGVGPPDASRSPPAAWE